MPFIALPIELEVVFPVPIAYDDPDLEDTLGDNGEDSSDG
jgi:hypothetical protein